MPMQCMSGNDPIRTSSASPIITQRVPIRFATILFCAAGRVLVGKLDGCPNEFLPDPDSDEDPVRRRLVDLFVGTVRESFAEV